jgi:hypothetical protein
LDFFDGEKAGDVLVTLGIDGESELLEVGVGIAVDSTPPAFSASVTLNVSAVSTSR